MCGELCDSTVALRLEWRVMDDLGRVETWFEDLELLTTPSGEPQWRSTVRDEDGARPSAVARARVRGRTLVAVWELGGAVSD